MAADCDYLVCRLHAAAARQYLDNGAAQPAEYDERGNVTIIRLTGKPVTLDARPGSYGVSRKHVPTGASSLCGGIIFSHKPTYERLST